MAGKSGKVHVSYLTQVGDTWSFSGVPGLAKVCKNAFLDLKGEMKNTHQEHGCVLQVLGHGEEDEKIQLISRREKYYEELT